MTELEEDGFDEAERIARPRMILHALIVAVIAAVLTVPILDIDRHEWKVPIHDTGDALLHQMMIRTVIDHGWIFHNPQLNAPFGLDLRDFPAWDFLTLALAKILGIFTSDIGLIANLTFLITFPLLAASTFLSMRWIGIQSPFSAAGALIYTFLPYHLIKGVGHLFLTNFAMLPPALALAVIVSRGDGPRRSHYVVAVSAGLLLGLNGVYYPAFALVTLGFAVILRMIRDRSPRGAAPALTMMAVVLATVIACLLPVMQRRADAGPVDSGRRHHAESEMYALKPAAMFLPVQGHLLSDLADLRDRYSAAPLYFENDTVALGIVGTLGIAWLLFHLVGRVLARRKPRPTADALSLLAAAAIAWASVGGGSSLFALIVTPQIRTWARMVTVIAFFAVAAAMYALQGRLRRYHTPRPLPWMIAIAIVALAVADQASSRFDFHGPEQYPDAERRWISSIASLAGKDAAIFQYPPYPYPENGPIGSAHDYDYFLPYLHSDGLRWSYGATKGSAQMSWQEATVSLPADEMLGRLRAAGFDAILVDRAALEDTSPSFLPLLPAAGESPGGRWTLHVLPSSAGVTGELRDEAFGQPLLTMEEGISFLENVEPEPYRWASRSGSLAVHNLTPEPREILVTFRAESAVPGDWRLILSRGAASGVVPLDEEADELYRVRLTVPHGRTVIDFRTDAPRLEAPRDPRVLVFRIFDAEVEGSGRGAGTSR